MIFLGTTRPCPLDKMENIDIIGPASALVSKTTKINYHGRYIEPRVSEVIEEPIIFFSRMLATHEAQAKNESKLEKEQRITTLQNSVQLVMKRFGIEQMIAVDCGGDSLILEIGDYPNASPFSGGDAEMLSALRGIPNVILGILSPGIDINLDAFKKNVNLLRERGAYYGRINMATGEKQEWTLKNDWFLPNRNSEFSILEDPAMAYLSDYFQFCETILRLNDEDQTNSLKQNSHTAVIAYHALKGNYGIKRTYVSWEPITNGVPGFDVKPDYAWIYFFNAAEIEILKLELNIKNEEE